MIAFKKNYPVILLAADERTSIDDLRHELSGSGIYFHAVNLTEAKKLFPKADVIIVYSPEYSSPVRSLTDHISDSEKDIKAVYIGDARDITESEKIMVLPPNFEAVVTELTALLRESFNFNPTYAEDDEIVCELIKPAQVYYNGTKIMLSKSEAKIVHFLLTVEPKTLVPKETIGEYLALAPGAVPVHIHNINDKSMKTYHDKLIFSRSSRGYFVY